MAPAVCAAGECPPCLSTAVTYVAGLYSDQRVGESQVGVCLAWRAAGSPCALGNSRSNDAGVLRHSPFQPVTSDYACVVASAYREFDLIQQRLGLCDIAGLPRRKDEA